jgi:hypothetical protein
MDCDNMTTGGGDGYTELFDVENGFHSAYSCFGNGVSLLRQERE